MGSRKAILCWRPRSISYLPERATDPSFRRIEPKSASPGPQFAIHVMKKTFYALSATFLLSTAIAAQTPKPTASPTPDTGQAVVVTTRRVRLPITVKDKKGQFVTGLTQND